MTLVYANVMWACVRVCVYVVVVWQGPMEEQFCTERILPSINIFEKIKYVY